MKDVGCMMKWYIAPCNRQAAYKTIYFRLLFIDVSIYYSARNKNQERLNGTKNVIRVNEQIFKFCEAKQEELSVKDLTFY